MSFKFIDKIGLEIEGGWDKSRGDLIADGSVHVQDFVTSPKCTGELVSQPFSDIGDAISFVMNNWPTESTKRCGFHIHVSFKNIAYYSALMERKFFDYFIQKMTEFGEKWDGTNRILNPLFWERLEDKNQFCRKIFAPDKQVKLKAKGTSDRYTQINYCYSFHKTVECRLFPTFIDPNLAVAALKALVNCYESYLSQNETVLNKEISFTLDEECDEIKKHLKKSSDKITHFNYFFYKGLIAEPATKKDYKEISGKFFSEEF